MTLEVFQLKLFGSAFAELWTFCSNRNRVCEIPSCTSLSVLTSIG